MPPKASAEKTTGNALRTDHAVLHRNNGHARWYRNLVYEFVLHFMNELFIQDASDRFVFILTDAETDGKLGARLGNEQDRRAPSG